LIARAKRTPYYDLPGYMNRYWLVPYNVVIERTVWLRSCNDLLSGYYPTTDGTGPVTWRRPFAKLFQLCGIAIRVHEILRSDEGREPHDHPWPYLTIILKGGYFENRYSDAGEFTGMRWHGPGSIIFRPANSWHMLELDGKPATTLFITGRKSQTWGFNVDGAKVPYYEYLNKPEKKELS
jgi:hypothetical protein